MRIVIETDHSPDRRTVPPSWDALQRLLLTALYEDSDHDSASESHMVRISRNDGGANYRAHGDYTVTLRDGATVRIHTEG